MARRTSHRRGTRHRVTLLTRNALCVLGGISERRLAIWEREELILPLTAGARSERLYDSDALRRIRVIRTLEEELDVNLPGIGVILNLLEQFPR